MNPDFQERPDHTIGDYEAFDAYLEHLMVERRNAVHTLQRAWGWLRNHRSSANDTITSEMQYDAARALLPEHVRAVQYYNARINNMRIQPPAKEKDADVTLPQMWWRRLVGQPAHQNQPQGP